jgi:hypothetical protein
VSKNLRDLLEFFVGIGADTHVDDIYREMALSFLTTAIRLYSKFTASLILVNANEYSP